MGSSSALFKTKTGQSKMTGNFSISFINNCVSNYSRGNCFDVFKYSELDDNKTTSQSAYHVVDTLVETAQVFTKPLTHTDQNSLDPWKQVHVAPQAAATELLIAGLAQWVCFERDDRLKEECLLYAWPIIYE
jgi:hypothetical protein